MDKYIVGAIILNNLLSVRSINNKKNKRFYFISIYSSFYVLPLCRSKFMNFIIFLPSKELLLTFLPRQVYRQTSSLSIRLSKKVFISPSLLKDNSTGFRIPG